MSSTEPRLLHQLEGAPWAIEPYLRVGGYDAWRKCVMELSREGIVAEIRRSGIGLEYYFSRVDNRRYCCGTKMPHNITGLIGVMDGAHTCSAIGHSRSSSTTDGPISRQLSPPRGVSSTANLVGPGSYLLLNRH